MASAGVPGVSFHDLSAGQVRALVYGKDWTATPLGPRERWPRSLSNYLSMIFELPTAAIIFWGPDQIQLYNDGYSVIMGPRHPRHLGSAFRECWPEAYSTIYPWMQRVLQNGETVEVIRTLVPLTRFGFTEEAYFTFSFSPLRDDKGDVAGILQLVTEVTGAVLGERRAAALHELSNQIALAKTPDDATRLAAEVLSRYSADLPFCLTYVVDPVDGQRLTLSGRTGPQQDDRRFPPELDLRRTETMNAFPEVRRAVEARTLVLIENAGRPAFASPVTAPDQQRVVAVLVGGISPQLTFDSHYRGFLQLICAQLATLMAAARAYDDERKRAEALAEIDRAKTEFFSNVSHEFRTPLTLILGPLEDALRDPSQILHGDVLAAAHRNALRMLRLVNTLLDFARLEANRLTSSFEPTDLPVLTAGLAGSFQSLIEAAGLKLSLDCAPFVEPVYVDRSQWEKIVLNLVSNAFKFTFEGEIAVRLLESDRLIHLSVSDTGTGIPEEDLENIFTRFHRVKGARGRSFEGTGIGLALVHELAKQHGGAVKVESVVGKGTTFTVSIPKRTTGPLDTHVSSTHSSGATSNAAAYVLEAARWTTVARPPATVAADQTAATRPAGSEMLADGQSHILVVDDNADMREHLVRLLSPKWSVETAEDGQAGLEAALRRPPDLILSDVMMPRMDGVAFVNALRAQSATSTIPVVFLSARAGEEAVIDGFETGVDDYLVKPFAARELLARVQAHLQMAQLRRKWARELEHANKELEAFSYSVSHDLRAPLRAIDGFSKALLANYPDKLDEEGRHCLDRVCAATQRMGQLIDDLLSLARITRAPLVRERVDLTFLCKKVLAELREREPGRALESIIAEGLVADGDPRLVTVALENLVANAWKFSSRQRDPRIEVGREKRPGEDVFFVRDNGAGFDMKYAEKLFTPFQRLHGQAEFEGTGIGLATVQRIVARHGGRVWADAATGRGATFFFTLGERS